MRAKPHAPRPRHLIVRDDEHEEFEALRAYLLAELSPEGTVDTLTFNEVLHAAWNLRRFRRLEAECFSGNTDPVSDKEREAFLDRLARYQSRAQRAYYRALAELRTLQTNRALRALKLDQTEQAGVPAIADINELTKQTHSEVTKEAIRVAADFLDLEGAMILRTARRRDWRYTAPPAPKPAA